MNDKTKSHRGRPVGSGINDRERLSAVAELLAANPGMKPTTAIRSLGITDPSIVRRLRDKWKAGPAQATGNGRPELAPHPGRAQHCAAAADTVRSFTIREDVPAGGGTAPPASPTADIGFRPAPLLVAWIGLTVGVWTTALAAQQAMIDSMLQTPLIRAALSQHITVNELTMSLLTVPVTPRRTV